MSNTPRIGQRVRINESYRWIEADKRHPGNLVGEEFTVTAVVHATPPQGHKRRWFVRGDEAGFGVWGDYIDSIGEPLRFEITNVSGVGTVGLLRVSVRHGEKYLLLGVSGMDGKAWKSHSIALTPEAAEEVAHDLLARVAEIRGTSSAIGEGN